MYISTLDLTKGYWQIPMSKEDQEKTTFMTHQGLFEITVMPFGLKNTPSTSQGVVDMML